MGLAESVLKAVEEPVDFKFLYDLQVCKLCSFTLHHSFILTSVIVCKKMFMNCTCIIINLWMITVSLTLHSLTCYFKKNAEIKFGSELKIRGLTGSETLPTIDSQMLVGRVLPFFY